jgi:hypothetical protein
VGQLDEEFGKLGNTEAAQKLLDSDYGFTPDSDEATVALSRRQLVFGLNLMKYPPPAMTPPLRNLLVSGPLQMNKLGRQ